MGFMDKAKEQAAQQQAAWTENRAATAQAQEAARAQVAAAVRACPDPGNHYVTEVNKGSIRMQTWQSNLNGMFSRGYRLAHVFEQDDNTIQVFEHFGH